MLSTHHTTAAKNTRWIYAILFLLTIPLGLATRRAPQYFPAVVQEYGGDALYATCVFLGWRFLRPRQSLLRSGIVGYLFCCCIELQQLYQAPWIVQLRHTFPFGLILGFGFKWSDCICYAAGTLAGAAIALPVEWLCRKRFAHTSAR